MNSRAPDTDVAPLDALRIRLAVPREFMGEHNASALALLDDSERARAARFRRELDRDSYIAAHALLRQTLSDVVELEPASWRFTEPGLERPELVTSELPAAAQDLRFSLSHTRGLVAVAVTRTRACGVDVEALERRNDPLEVVGRVCSASERAELNGIEDLDRRRWRFLQLWTLKESVAKASGKGLSIEVARLEFEFKSQRAVLAAAPSDYAGYTVAALNLESCGIENALGAWSLATNEPAADIRVDVRRRRALDECQ